MHWAIIGVLAALLTMFGFVPQIVRVWRTKSIKDVSPITLFQIAAGVLLWVIYGIGRRDPIIIIGNIVTLTTLLILIGLYFSYKKAKHER